MAPEETRTISLPPRHPPAAGLGEHVDQRVDPVGVEAAGGGGQRGGADLDHDPAGRGHLVPYRRPVLLCSRRSPARPGLVPASRALRRALSCTLTS